MTWPIVFVLGAGVLAQRMIGMFVGGRVLTRFPAVGRLASLIPAAVVMAVIVQLSIATRRTLTVDARLAGMIVAAILVWKRAPFVAVVVAAAVVTAAVRAIGG